MKKTISAIIVFISAVLLLAGCSPAGNFIEETTAKPPIGGFAPPTGNVIPNDCVIYSGSINICEGEYYYYFSQFLSNLLSSLSTEAQERLGLNSVKSIKEIILPDSNESLYDSIRDMTVSYMTDILLVNEAAYTKSNYYSTLANNYIEQTVIPALNAEAAMNNMSGYIEYINQTFHGAVSSSAYINAIRLEYIYNTYSTEKGTELSESITTEAAEQYASTLEGEKDTTLSKNITFVTVDGGIQDAEAFLSSFLAGEKTKDSLNTLANGLKYTVTEIQNITKNSDIHENVIAWADAQERTIGDATALSIENDGCYVLFYGSDGEAQYLISAKSELTQNLYDEWITELKSTYTITSFEEKLNGLNA